MPGLRTALLLFAFGSAVIDCSSKSSVRGPECTPGEQRPCTCDNGRSGTQECEASASTYSQCQCGGEDAAGGQAGAGGTAGTNGSDAAAGDGGSSSGGGGSGGIGGDASGGTAGLGGTGGTVGTGGTIATGGTGGISATGGTGGTSTGGTGGTNVEDPNVCPGETIVLDTASVTITRSLVSMSNDYPESCGGLEEAVFRVVAPQTGVITVTVDPLSAWGAALVVRAGSCTAAEIDCRTGAANAPVTMAVNAFAGTEYFIFPARFTGAFGNYTLTVSQ